MRLTCVGADCLWPKGLFIHINRTSRYANWQVILFTVCCKGLWNPSWIIPNILTKICKSKILELMLSLPSCNSLCTLLKAAIFSLFAPLQHSFTVSNSEIVVSLNFSFVDIVSVPSWYWYLRVLLHNWCYKNALITTLDKFTNSVCQLYTWARAILASACRRACFVKKSPFS